MGRIETAADFVKRVREALGWSQERFGRAIGKDRKTILRWEKGENEPKHSDVIKIQQLENRSSKKRGA